MSLTFERFLAFRYLRGAQGRAEGKRFLRFVTYVAVGGVAVGTAALLLALSIVRGFSTEIETKIVGFGAHVQVESFRDAPIDDSDALAASLRLRAGVTDVASVVQEFVLLRKSSTRIDGVSLWGAMQMPGYVQSRITAGEGVLGTDSEGRRRIVIGARLASRLGLGVGDTVTAFSVRGQVSGAERSRARVRVKPFVVTGLFETDLANFDEIYAFVDIGHARELLQYAPDEVSRFDLTLSDPATAQATARSIEEAHGFPIMARSIYEVYRSLFAWVRLQQRIIPLVIAVIILVAAFNIIGTLLMILLEKTREIGVLLTIGAGAAALRRTFTLFGVLIGMTGILIGEGLALGLALAQQRWQIVRLPAEAYFMSSAPIEISAVDFVVVAVVTVALCGVSAYLPARFAARIEPIRAIHFR